MRDPGSQHRRLPDEIQPHSSPVTVTWIRDEGAPFAPPPAPTVQRRERTSTAIVIVLTVACTALSILDLFLLASNVQ
jgi:hypothetical protein